MYVGLFRGWIPVISVFKMRNRWIELALGLDINDCSNQ